MGVEDTIFRGLTQENENSVTELLVNMMRIDEKIKEVVLTYLLKETEISYEMVQKAPVYTQGYFNEGNNTCIPDIFINTDECFIIIENKITRERGLEENQKDAYIALLKNERESSKKVAYIFLVPRHSVSEEAVLYLQQDEGIVSLCYWSDLLSILEKCKQSVRESRKELIDQCYKYIKGLVYGNEIDSELLEQISGYGDIRDELNKKKSVMDSIQNALQKFCTNNGGNWKIGKYDCPPCSFGFGLYYNGVRNAYVGCDLSSTNSAYSYSIQIIEAYCSIEKLTQSEMHSRVQDGREKQIAFPLEKNNLGKILDSYLCVNNTKGWQVINLPSIQKQSFGQLQEYQQFLRVAYTSILELSRKLCNSPCLMHSDQYGLSDYDNDKNKRIGKFFNYKNPSIKKPVDKSVFIGFAFELADSKPDFVFCLAVKRNILREDMCTRLSEAGQYDFYAEKQSFSQSADGKYFYDDGTKWIYFRLEKDLLLDAEKLFREIEGKLVEFGLITKDLPLTTEEKHA